MKCPKCHYIGFEAADRCRNCGFDFSLSPVGGAADPDLALRSAEPLGPLADFDLGDAHRPIPTPQGRGARRRHDASLDPMLAPSNTPPVDLPLFGEVSPEDAPLVRPAAAAPPLSVRRSTPAPARARTPVPSRPAERPADVGLPLEDTLAAAPVRPPVRAADQAGGEVAALGSRVGAAAVDWLMLLGLDLAVVYFTLRVSRVPAAEFLSLPLAPLAAFLVLLNGGYLALFTAAGGQTIGKMAFGLKVVSASGAPLSSGRALVRVVALLLGAAAGGVGLWPATLDGARRALHDRLADTRVVRAS
jgi:uncharacterized RDD family membrane protein YckC